MGRKLRIWNGRWYPYSQHAFVAAYSRADAVRLINKTMGWNLVSDSEIKNYWSEGCWGDSMEGITPERGIWVQESWLAPIKRLA